MSYHQEDIEALEELTKRIVAIEGYVTKLEARMITFEERVKELETHRSSPPSVQMVGASIPTQIDAIGQWIDPYALPSHSDFPAPPRNPELPDLPIPPLSPH